MEERIAKWIVVRNMYSIYSDTWYAHNKLIASLVRIWRKTNTLKSVK